MKASSTKRVKFSPEEDNILRDQAMRLHESNWEEIATFVPGRSARQCRDRYVNYLAPDVKIGDWTPEEDTLIYNKVCEIGTKFSKIVQFLNGRTSQSIKNRWYFKIMPSAHHKLIKKNFISTNGPTLVPNYPYKIVAEFKESFDTSPTSSVNVFEPIDFYEDEEKYIIHCLFGDSLIDDIVNW